jgi:hypothetical protein
LIFCLESSSARIARASRASRIGREARDRARGNAHAKKLRKKFRAAHVAPTSRGTAPRRRASGRAPAAQPVRRAEPAPGAVGRHRLASHRAEPDGARPRRVVATAVSIHPHSRITRIVESMRTAGTLRRAAVPVARVVVTRSA